MAGQELYPSIEPYETGELAPAPPHRLYWELSGNPEGRPVVFLHGGPGAGASPDHRRFFDPERYKIVIFDQRGAGRSTPLGDLSGNTTADIVADIERLREELGLEDWLVFGGSWGSTLALAYAQAHPERVTGLILRGIFLGRPREIDWFLHGIRNFFPDIWRPFAEHLPEAERVDLLANYYKRLIDPDPEVHLPAARAWSRYEGACSTLLPSPETVAAFADDGMALGLSRIEAHYFINRLFLEEGALLRGVDKIRHIPAVIVQGRYDVICPVATADTLHQAWPEADYQIIPEAGHSAMEPAIRAALIEATRRFAED